MSTGIYSIGITGMNAAQLGLVTTEHNISNAFTAGYSRQRTVQAANVPIMTGAGSVGQGTHVATIERMYSNFLTTQVNNSQSTVSELDAYYSEISQIDNMLADSNAGLTPALQDFFKGVQQVAASPSSLSARQSLVSSAQSLVSRFKGLESRLDELADGVNNQVTSVVGTINSYAKQIASLNERIVLAQSSSSQPANDLLDERDQLVSELNKLVKVNVTQDTNGAYNVFIGTGQQLVVGVQTMQLTAVASEADPERVVVGLKSVGGNVQELPEDLVTGGQLGGLLRFRSESLDSAFNQLGRVATSLALTFNAQNGLGQDLLGNNAVDAAGNPVPSFVSDFFTLAAPRVTKNAGNGGDAVVTASFTTPAPSNGTNFYTNLTDSDYSLQWDGANFKLTRLSDNKVWTGPDIATINAQIGDPPASDPQGFSLNMTWTTLSVNDKFTIQPTREAARNIGIDSRVAADPRLIAAAAPVRSEAALTNTGTMKMGQGVVSSGYSIANLPVTVTADAAVPPRQLSGFPGGAVATYSDGSTASAAGAANLLNGTATLKSVTFDGMTFDFSGSAGANDSFTISRNTAANGVSDGRNIVLLGKLQSQKTISGGTSSYQSSYAQLVSDNGNRTREAQVTSEAQQALLEQAQSSRDALSGVNLDEEAANLIRYQQAYQASAKMLEIGAKLFDTLLSLNT